MKQIYLNDYPGSASPSLQARRDRTEKPETIILIYNRQLHLRNGGNPNFEHSQI
jgi:hypothetical protein